MSEKNYLSPQEIAEYTTTVAENKIKMSFAKSFSLAVLAGMYIGFGGLLVVLVGAGASDLPYGLLKLLMGLVFSIGLILVVVGGGELFTGSTIVALVGNDKKYSWAKVFKNWSIVYFGNLVGALLLAALILMSGQYDFGGGLVSESMLKIAAGKLHHGFLAAVVLGALCNIFVCLGLWLSYAAKDISGKILAIIFPITAFVSLGFEHSVANMYLLSSAYLLNVFEPSLASAYPAAASINLANIIFANLLPVTIGNILGGVFVWFIYRFAYKN